MTRLAILSDVHANTPALRAVADDLRRRDADAVAFLGDIVFRGPDPSGSIDLLASLRPVAWIRGNTDEWYLPGADAGDAGGFVEFGQSLLSPADRELLAGMPKQAVVALGETSVLCVHGSPRAQAENVRPDTPLDEILEGVSDDVVACGHTHLPFVRREGRVTVVNDGSAGIPFDGDPRASYALLSTRGDGVDVEIVRVAYDAEETLALARAAGMPGIANYERALREGVPAFG